MIKTPQSQPAAVQPFSVFDRDLTGLQLRIADPVRLHGEIVWDGDPPTEPVKLALTLHFAALRPFAPSASAGASVPGEFDAQPLAPDEYGVDLEVPHGYYAKDVLYGGVSVLNRAFHIDESDRMQVIVGRDGGAITARLADADGVPIESAVVWFLPHGAATAAELGASLTSCITGRDGTCSSPTLRPGKYAVLGTVEHLGQSVAHMDRLFAGRSKGKEVELPAHGSASVSLTPVVLF